VPDTTDSRAIDTQETTSTTSAVPDGAPSSSTGAPSPSDGEDVTLGGGPALPRTGAPIGMLVLVGVALIAGGEFLRRCARYADGK
jgi:hypothetical protein